MKNKIFQLRDLCLRALDTNLTCAKSVRGKEEKSMKKSMKKSIITVVGKDTVGIIARVCAYLADNNINILDISQTIVQGYFNMMMIVDMNNVSKEFGTIAQELDALGENIGVIIKCQREEIFDQMHRI